MTDFNYSFYQKSADYILSKIPQKPEIGLVLGSSLGDIAKLVQNPTILNYADIPNFLLSTVPSHSGKMIFGTLADRSVVLMSGRFHYYEGYSYEQLAAPMRVFSLLGVRSVVLTNAAGGINTDFCVGDVMVINDHINLVGASPMRGGNIPEFGSRFFDISHVYTPRLRALAHKAAKDLDQGEKTKEGVYFYFVGPHFETPAEIRAARILGADTAGMSTVTEALTAAHCGMEVLAFSLVTNMAAGVLDAPIDDQEVGVAARAASGRISALLTKIIKEI